MTRIHNRLKATREWVTPLPPLLLAKLNKNIKSARNVRILHASLMEFEVIDMSVLPSGTYTLDLQKRSCDCGIWQISGVPCQHIVCFILHMNFSLFELFVDEKLRILAYMTTYSGIIHPVSDKRNWPAPSESKLLLPHKQPTCGKARKMRRRDPDE
ncbi:uncharacterized protein LOC123227870 [Mangifera indica]|uniref:uncharacterized protein LOC123227870 n=1 Tax=Mangifera indica TaxID=29780 RepID=UPI001CFB6864|nr:uncharacterized protein LOC123227870 [Mangifera indica]